MRKKHGTILTGAAVIAATIVLTFSQTLSAATGACCPDIEPYTCNTQKCGTCPYSTCNPDLDCGHGAARCHLNGDGPCIDVDRACVGPLCNYQMCDLVQGTEGEENTSEGDVASWPDEGLDEEIKDAASPMPLWILALPTLLLLPIVPALIRRRRNG